MIDKQFVEKHWDVLVALKEGKQIQYFSPTQGDWIDCKAMDDDERYELRVKPEKFLKAYTGEVRIVCFKYKPVAFRLCGKVWLMFVNKVDYGCCCGPIEITNEEYSSFITDGLSETWLKEKIGTNLEVLD